jgi:hypothetical protein
MAVDPLRADRPVFPATAGESPGHRLDRFVRKRLELIAARLPSDAAPLDDSLAREVRTLESLSSLRKDHLVATPKRRELVPVAVLAMTAVVVTSLVFLPLPSVRAEMDVLCSGVTFRTQRTVQLTGLSSLKLLQGVAFAPTQVEEPVNLQTIVLKPPLELRPRESQSLTLGSITIPADTNVAIQKTEDAGTWSLQMASPQATVAATLAGPVDVASADAGSATVNFGHGARVTFEADKAGDPMLEIHITPANAGSLLVRRTIPVTNVSFEESIEDSTPGSIGLLRGKASSVLEGKIFNESLGGRQSTLRNREAVDISLIEGQVRELQVTDAGLHVNLSGSARELKIGNGDDMESLRPSYLEWLAEYHTLQLAWGSAAWLLGLVLGGLKWLQR